MFASLILVLAGLSAAEPNMPTSSSPAESFRLGIVGLVHGHVAGFLHDAAKRNDVELVGIAEPDAALRADCAKRHTVPAARLFASLDDMLAAAKPDAVAVFTNTFDHRTVAETCAKRGVHVMMEKPLAVSIADARAMQAAAARGNIQLLVNYETTWYASNRAALELVQSGKLGPIRKIVAHAGHFGPKEIGCGPEFLTWLTDPAPAGGGALYDFGCYGADLAAVLLDGQRPESVTAVTRQLKPAIYPNVDDDATIIVNYPAAQVIIQASWNWPFDRKDIEIYGERGSVRTIGRDKISVRLPGEREESIIAVKAIPPPEQDLISYLRAIVNEDKAPSGLSSLATNVIVSQILDAARESARTSRTIRLEDPIRTHHGSGG